jgi:hypothetical protein
VLSDIGISVDFVSQFCNVSKEAFVSDSTPPDISLKENVYPFGNQPDHPDKCRSS